MSPRRSVVCQLFRSFLRRAFSKMQLSYKQGQVCILSIVMIRFGVCTRAVCSYNQIYIKAETALNDTGNSSLKAEAPLNDTGNSSLLQSQSARAEVQQELQSTAFIDTELQATALSNTGERKYCFCKSVATAEECKVEKYGRGIRHLRFFQTTRRGNKCCKWSRRGTWTQSGPGKKYSEVRSEEEKMCELLQPDSCCHHWLGVSFYLREASYNKYITDSNVYASLANAEGATLGNTWVPHYLLYKFLVDSVFTINGSEYRIRESTDCDSITPNSETCDLGVDLDTFHHYDLSHKNMCCRSDDYGLSFYVSKQLSIKDWYEGRRFSARHHITGAHINGKLFPGGAIQRYMGTLPEFWPPHIKHHGASAWPYFCTNLIETSRCELIANQQSSNRAGYHGNYLKADTWQLHEWTPPKCCHLEGIGLQKLSVLVTATFIVPGWSSKHLSDVDFITVELGNHDDEREKVRKRSYLQELKSAIRGRTGHYLTCERLDTGACPLHEKGRPDGI